VALVQCPRLTDADLEVWRRNEAADRLYAVRFRRRLDRLAAQARSVIRDALNRGPAYVSISWGKDSLVVLDLALSVDPNVLVVHIVQGAAANPDDMLVRDEALARWPLNYIEVDCDRDAEYTWSTWVEQTRAASEFGRRIVGIRAEESRQRQLSAAVHGYATEHSIRPILRWRVADVWAWIARRDLPAHPVYAMTGGGVWPREWLRVGGLLDFDQVHSMGTGLGRAEWERRYYGGVAVESWLRWSRKEANMDRGKGKGGD